MANHVVAWPWWLWLIGVMVVVSIIGVILTAVAYAAIFLAPIALVGGLAWRIRENRREWAKYKEEHGIEEKW